MEDGKQALTVLHGSSQPPASISDKVGRDVLRPDAPGGLQWETAQRTWHCRAETP